MPDVQGAQAQAATRLIRVPAHRTGSYAGVSFECAAVIYKHDNATGE